MRDHVVQLAGDPGTFLDHGLPPGDVSFALRDLRALLAVPNDTADDQQRDKRAETPGNAVGRARTDGGARGKAGDRDRRGANGEASG